MPELAQATDSYSTPLTAQEQSAFSQWLKKLSEKNGRDMSNDTADYDMAGAFKAGYGQSDNGHFDDRFKKPNHMTFSTDSQYSGKLFTGGSWKKEGGTWTFQASKDNLKFHTREELVDYFKRVEPTSKLYLPGEKTPAYDGTKAKTIAAGN